MTHKKTARELLAWTENTFFKDVNLTAGSLLEGEERRAFKLSQVERLMTWMNGSCPFGLYLSDQFWTADKGRIEREPRNPMTSLKEQQKLTDEERSRLRMILEVAGLCHDLGLHFTFDLEEAFGIKSESVYGFKIEFDVSNRQLVEWLSTTPYERIAMHTAYIIKKHYTDTYAYGHYQPAQDALAELFSSEYSCLVRDPDDTEIPPRAYVKTIIDAILEIEQHWEQGHKKKLRPDLIKLHDEIYGVVPRQFDKDVLKAARALYDYMDREVCGRMTGDNPFNPELMKHFANKVREVRAQYLPEGWIADNSLEFYYLMAHAEWCGYGWWREEDEAL